MIKSIVVAVVRGLAVILICVYTFGSSLYILRIITPIQFLRPACSISMFGFPFLLAERRYQRLEEEASRNERSEKLAS